MRVQVAAIRSPFPDAAARGRLDHAAACPRRPTAPASASRGGAVGQPSEPSKGTAD